MTIGIVRSCWDFESLPDAAADYSGCFAPEELGVMGPRLASYVRSFEDRKRLTGMVNFQPPTIVKGINNLVIPWIGRGFGPYQERWGGVTAARIADYLYAVSLITRTGKVERIEIAPPGIVREGLLPNTFQLVGIPAPCLPPGVQFGQTIQMVSTPGEVVKILNAEIGLSQARLVTAIDTNFIEGIASIAATLGGAAAVAPLANDCVKSFREIFEAAKAGKVGGEGGAIEKIGEVIDKSGGVFVSFADWLKGLLAGQPDVLDEIFGDGKVEEAQAELCALLRGDDQETLAQLAQMAAPLFGVTGEIEIGKATLTLDEFLEELQNGRLKIRCASDPCPAAWVASPTFDVAGQTLKLCMSPEFMRDRGIGPTIPGTNIPLPIPDAKTVGAIIGLLIFGALLLLIGRK